MSGEAPLTLQQLRGAIAPAGLDGQIAEVATMASVGLALLTYFIDRQATTMKTLSADLTAFTKPEITGQLFRDILLALLAAVGVAGVAPFIVPLLEALHLFQRTDALRLLFLVVVVGYVALVLFQASIIWRRAKRRSEKT